MVSVFTQPYPLPRAEIELAFGDRDREWRSHEAGFDVRRLQHTQLTETEPLAQNEHKKPQKSAVRRLTMSSGPSQECL